jgi:hypothetical protein
MDAVVDRYFPVLEAIETELDKIEERIFANGSPGENIEALYGLKQKLTKIRHAVAPLLESLDNLSGARVPAVCVGMTEYFRDISDHLQRLNQTIESVRETVSTAISVNLSMITLQESETMKRLAAYAALVAIPTMIAGIYGMNFDFMPELEWKYGYAAALGAMAALEDGGIRADEDADDERDRETEQRLAGDDDQRNQTQAHIDEHHDHGKQQRDSRPIGEVLADLRADGLESSELDERVLSPQGA